MGLTTNKGLNLISKAIGEGRPLDIKYVWITSNTGVPAASDTTDDFCTFGVDDVEGFVIDNWFSNGAILTAVVMMGPAKGNFTWKKIGILDSNLNLIFEDLYTYSAKTNVDYAQVDFSITIS